MEIRYKDYADEIITEQQALTTGSYDKVFIENGNIKKIFQFDNFILDFIEYYIDNAENEMEIVENLTPLAAISVDIISPKEPLGAYFVVIEREYRNNVLVQKGRMLYDAFNNLIAAESTDIDTDLPILGEIIKWFYGFNPTEDADEIFRAEYNDDGTLFEITFRDFDPLGKTKYYNTSNFSDMVAGFPGNPDLSYYLDSTFEP